MVKQTTFFLVVTILLNALSLNLFAQQAPSGFNNAYHDLTAKYNAYFNARLIYDEALIERISSEKENFDTILTPDIYSGYAGLILEAEEIDKILKKTATTIRIHKNSKWIDDCYLLLGIARYNQKDYEQAEIAFNTVIAKVDQGDREKLDSKSARKARNEQRTGTDPAFNSTFQFLYHKPARFEAYLWLARTQLMVKKPSKAEAILSSATQLSDWPRIYDSELNLILATAAIQQNQYEKAIAQLNESLRRSMSKEERARRHFIIGQLHSRLDNSKEAVNNFSRTIAFTNDFELEFQAKVNKAFALAGEKPEDVEKLLKEIISNPSYAEYVSDIYLKLGITFFQNNLIEKGIEYFGEAVASVPQDDQEKKTNTYIKIIEVLILNDEFQESGTYAKALSEFNDKVLEVAGVKIKTLALLGDYVSKIKLNDRILDLEYLSEEEQKIAFELLQDELNQEDEEEDSGFAFNDPSKQVAASWPFDNPALRAQGFNTFLTVWGEAPNIDNWRISSIRDGGLKALEDSSSTEEGKQEFDLSLSIEMPTSEEEWESLKSEQALLIQSAGILMEDKVNAPIPASELFTRILNEFPNIEGADESLYRLYNILDGLIESDPTTLALIEDRLYSYHTNSIYSNLITNPEFVEEQVIINSSANSYYASTVKLLEDKNYEAVKRQVTTAIGQPKVYSELLTKFHYLNAIAHIQTENYKPAQNSLQEVIQNESKNLQLKKNAEELLLRIGGKLNSTTDKASTKSSIPYVNKANQPHHVLVFVNNNVKAAKVQADIQDWLGKNMSSEKLTTQNLVWDNDQSIVKIDGLKDAKKASFVYQTLLSSSLFNGLVGQAKAQIVEISTQNLKLLFSAKDLDTYLQYYNSNLVN